jgi:serine/threonine-protein kinase RsbT
MSAAAGAQRRVRVALRDLSDVAIARGRTRELGREIGLGEGAIEAAATAVSEIALNVLLHARAGEVSLDIVAEGGQRGISVVASDKGPGIADLGLVMQDGYSTAGGLGLGLPSARRLMDEFELVSAPGSGTVVTMKKWGR